MRQRTLGSAAIIVALGFVGSRALGLVRDIVIGHTFGTRPELDAYFAAFRIPDALFQLLAGAALGSALIPTFMSYFAREQEAEAWELARSILNLLTGLTLVLSVVMIFLAPWIIPLLVRFPEEQQQLTVRLTQIMLLSPVWFSASGTIAGILNARRQFLAPAMAPLLYNLAIIAGAALLSERIGVYGLAIGVASGSFLHLLVQLPSFLKSGVDYRFGIAFRHPGVAEVFRLMVPRVLGLGTVQICFMITTFYASILPAGSVSALSYAWAIMMVPLGIFGVSLGTAIFPSLSEAAARKEWRTLAASVEAGSRLILFLTLPAAVGLILLREPVVGVLLQRGMFTASSTEATATALLFYTIALPANAVLEILSRGFYATQDTRTPLGMATVALVLHLILSTLLLRVLGHGGLALSLSFATLVETSGLVVLLHRRLEGLWSAGTLRASLKASAAAALMGAALLGAMSFVPFPPDAFWKRLVWLVAMTAMGASIYGAAALALGLAEAKVVWGVATGGRRVSGRPMS